jgi:hypothetical protein
MINIFNSNFVNGRTSLSGPIAFMRLLLWHIDGETFYSVRESRNARRGKDVFGCAVEILRIERTCFARE